MTFDLGHDLLDCVQRNVLQLEKIGEYLPIVLVPVTERNRIIIFLIRRRASRPISLNKLLLEFLPICFVKVQLVNVGRRPTLPPSNRTSIRIADVSVEDS